MLHFRMNMPFILMVFYGSLMIMIILLLRGLLKRSLPKFVFPVLWCMVLLRLLVPFSLSSPLSIKTHDNSFFSIPDILSVWDEYIISGSGDASTSNYVVQAQDVQASQGSADIPAEIIGKVDGKVIEAVETSAISSDASSVAVSFQSASGSGYYPFYISSRALLPVIYFSGLLLTVIILLLQKYRCHIRLKKCLLIEHNETINSILREMDMGHILVFTNDEIASPLVCGLFAPRIYLPTRMDFRNTELLRHILTHEAMHIKRKDNLIKAVMLVTLCINWFNPLVWLMSKYLSSDLESACDEAVLRMLNEDEARKSYASSLLAMAITGNRSTLLYSAFSKTEVERRIQNILQYKKASVLILMIATVFTFCSSALFSTVMPAPFSSYLTSYCASSDSRWGVKVELTRDIALGQNPQRRAENIVFDILNADTTQDPELMEIKMQNALADEFHVEKGAFFIDFSLCISDEQRAEEYASFELVKDKDGFFLYKGEPVRTFVDETSGFGFYQSRAEGSVDITVIRNRYGYVTNVLAQHEGDSDFDRRTRDIGRSQTLSMMELQPGGAAETTMIEN
ncbi:MAG: hypothetical protein K2K21_00025 [Lachnospiraceae bacterium]|nr:hypothetical protein [Lachnospiraceae bacterium]